MDGNASVEAERGKFHPWQTSSLENASRLRLQAKSRQCAPSWSFNSPLTFPESRHFMGCAAAAPKLTPGWSAAASCETVSSSSQLRAARFGPASAYCIRRSAEPYEDLLLPYLAYRRAVLKHSPHSLGGTETYLHSARALDDERPSAVSRRSSSFSFAGRRQPPAALHRIRPAPARTRSCAGPASCRC